VNQCTGTSSGVRSAILSANVIALAVLVAIAIYRAGRIRYDFDHFYLDARHIIDHGTINTDDNNPDEKARGRLQNYLPVAPLMFVPFAALGSWAGGAAWVLLNAVLLILSVRWVGTHLTGRPSTDWAIAQALPVWLCCAVIYEQFRFNQVSIVVLFLLLASYVLLDQGRDIAAGFAVALATVIKLMPAVFVLYLVLRRRWRAAIAAVTAAIILDLGASLLAFGWPQTQCYHRRWWHFVTQEHSGLTMMHPRPGSTIHPHFLDYHNQSPALVLAKALPGHREVAQWLYLVVMGTCAVAMVAVVRRGIDEGTWPRRLTFAAWLLTMLWFTPLLRQYYLIWAYPAVAVLVERVRDHHMAGRSARFAWTAIAIWVVSMIAWATDAWTGHIFRSAGVNLWAVAALVIALIVEAPRADDQDEGRSHDQASEQAISRDEQTTNDHGFR
jgi:alpha-1,2-mannosyltransferase